MTFGLAINPNALSSQVKQVAAITAASVGGIVKLTLASLFFCVSCIKHSESDDDYAAVM
jgi:hypothetical protein